MPIWNATTYRAEAVSADRGATRSTAACRATGSAVKPAPQTITAATVPAVEPWATVARAASATTRPATQAAVERRGQRSVIRPARTMPPIPAAPYPNSTADRPSPDSPASRRTSAVM